MSTDAYLRFPHVRGDQVVFVAENDIWSAGTAGGPAQRVSTDHVPVKSPRLSPGGTLVAWTATRHGANEVYAAPTGGGVTRRLTFWGQQRTVVRGWLDEQTVLVVSTTGEAERSRMYAHAVPADGSPSRVLPYGWIHDLALGPSGGVLLSTATTVEPAWWKGYRGGAAAQLWLDQKGDGEFTRILDDLRSGLVSPLWTTTGRRRQRLGFLSDHEGRGQLYSVAVGKRPPRTADLVRHTDHEFYVRHAGTDGRQVVYVAGGSLYLLDTLDPGARPREIEVRLGGGRSGLQRRPLPVDAAKLGAIDSDTSGRASVVEARGTVHWITHRNGPARALATGSAVRRRLPVVLTDTRAAWVTDSDGDDAIEVLDLEDPAAAPRRLVAAGELGRVLELVASPDGTRLAAAGHDGRLSVLDVPGGAGGRAARGAGGRAARGVRLREVDRTDNGDIDGLAWSPDSRWLAWSKPGQEPLRQIRMCEVARPRAQSFDVTELRFTDTEPTFTRDGKHLALLSVRSLDPVYDAYVFDLSFPNGCRPHLVPLAAHTPSPFDPLPGGRPLDHLNEGSTSGKSAADGADGSTATDRHPPAPVTTVDAEGLDQRVTAVPAPGGRYRRLRAVQGGLVWLHEPLAGELGDDRPRLEDDRPRAALEHLDLATGRTQTLAEAVDSVEVTGDGARLLLTDREKLSVVPADRKVDADGAVPAGRDGQPDPDVVRVDLDRLRVWVDPRAEWTQMYHEAWRLMRDHFWRADMGGVDWAAARDRYAPLLTRIGSHDDLVDLIWEMHGELGTSHAYCAAPADEDLSQRQGLLGADLEFTGGQWRITRIPPGESSEPRARSPLTAPGVAASVGDAVVAVDGQPTGEYTSPGALLVGAAGKPVELTLAPGSGKDRRRVVVVPLDDEMPLRYQDWVTNRRRYVHERTGGAVGYLHVPDMVSGGWAQLHRDLRTEVGRDALIVDVRANRGGHTSQLVVEKLARRIVGWSLSRGYRPESYPSDARRGPMVTVTDMHAGSDGDIVTAAIQSLQLGPVVGTRSWGGVIGIDGRYALVDGTSVTQPRYSFWFEKFGWGVENHGVDPDIEVVARPQDLVRRADVQLDHAIELALEQTARGGPQQPPTLPKV